MTIKIDEIPVPRPRKETPLTDIQKKFAKNYIKAMGNQTLAYKMTNPEVDGNTAKVQGCKLLYKPKIKREIQSLLEKEGMPKDYFIKRMKELAEVKDAKGNPIASVQWDVVKTGLEFHGILKPRNDVPQSVTQVNYNLDADKLGGVLTKLSEVTKKLELSNSFNKGAVENAEIIEGDSGGETLEEDTGSEERSGIIDVEGRLEASGDSEEA